MLLLPAAALLLASLLLSVAADDATTPTPTGTRSLVGVNYGVGLAKSPLPKQEAFALLTSKGVYRIKIFDTDLETVQAIQATIPDAEVTLGISNNDLAALARNESLALSLLTPFQPFASLLKYLALGSEPNESKDIPPPTLATILPSAFLNVNKALQALGMQATKVTVPFTMDLLEVSHPPSAGVFKAQWNATLAPLLTHLDATDAPFMMNIHPYGAWVHQQSRKRKHKPSVPIDLSYALGNSSVSITDGSYTYTSLLDALHDAVLAALARAGYPTMKVVVGETGWPSGGGKGATVGNACAYINHVVVQVNAGGGTPARPGQPLEVHLFSAFDELLKPAGTIEPNWGVLMEDGREKYAVDWVGKGSDASSCPAIDSSGRRWLRDVV